MSVILDYYEIELTIGTSTLDSTFADYSFSLSDSIFDIYNTATLFLNDTLSLYLESLSAMPGNPITIKYGLNNGTILESPFVLYDYESQESLTPRTLGSSLAISLINKWYNDQSINSEGYKSKISDLVQQKVSTVGFSSINIEETLNFESWYQGLQFDAQFIKNLAYYAYVPGSKSPFYSYVNTGHSFNFESYSSMIEKNIVAELRYEPEEEQNSDINVIRSIKSFSKGYKHLRKGLRRKLFSFDDQGELEVDEDKITDYPSATNQTFPVYRNKNYTNYFSTGEKKVTKGEVQNDLATLANSNFNRMNVDKLLIILPFNPNLLSGKLVKLHIYTYGAEDTIPDTLSQYSTSTWLIERCTHIWDGVNTLGLTKIVVGRKYTVLDSNYLNRAITFK